MDQSNCPGRERQLEEEAGVLVCMNVDPNTLGSNKVRLCVQPGEARHLGARWQGSLN